MSTFRAFCAKSRHLPRYRRMYPKSRGNNKINLLILDAYAHNTVVGCDVVVLSKSG